MEDIPQQTAPTFLDANVDMDHNAMNPAQPTNVISLDETFNSYNQGKSYLPVMSNDHQTTGSVSVDVANVGDPGVMNQFINTGSGGEDMNLSIRNMQKKFFSKRCLEVMYFSSAS